MSGVSALNLMPVDGVPSGEGMTGAERAGLVLALAGHALLFALLSTGWSMPPAPLVPASPPIEVSLVKEVTLESTAPPAVEPPAPSIAPDVGAPEDAAPAAPIAKPDPIKPAPPQPAPKPVEAEPVVVTKSAPAPRPASRPVAKPVIVRPVARPQSATPVKAAARPQPIAAKPAARPSRLAGLGSSLAAGARADATAPRARGRRLGDDIVAGLSADAPRRSASATAPGAKAGPFPTASIQQAIARQIQPCADRQVNPGPGANRIVTTLAIRLNADGTLAATPRMVRQGGTDGENERYAQRVVDLGIAAFRGCTPLRLPADYYQTAAGGWSVLNYQWQLR